MKQSLVGITMGDPAGVGPELVLRALSSPEVLDRAVPLVFGDAAVLARVAAACGLPAPPPALSLGEWNSGRRVSGPAVVDLAAIDAASVVPGQVDPVCGRAAFTYIEAAIRAAMAGRIVAVATAPIHKEALRLAGVPYPGHTEMFADLTQADPICMMLASEHISVSLVTTHCALAEVLGGLSIRRVLEVIELTGQLERRIGKTSPRITVCGLNPHAGEHGLFGDEERTHIEPAIASARAAGWTVDGPLPPDTAFLPECRARTDAYVVMYHDQGLIPFKMLAFDTGVNITLGLPIVRTSVDHGTAFDIAWQGRASASSMIQSVLWAARLGETRSAPPPAVS